MQVPNEMIGQTLGRYRVIEKVGAGGMGEVYRAHDERLDRDVALKVLPAGALANEAARKRFRKEALALSKLNHPNIQTVHDFDTQGGVDFLVTEYVAGASLDDKLAAGALREKELIHLGRQLADGLAAAHAKQVVHRDLKPGNLRLTPDGRLKILDFGLAKLLKPREGAAGGEGPTESASLTQAVVGTLPYMSPEQLQGEEVDARTDIYAAGVVLYEMATGRRPFQERTSTALVGAILHTPPSPPRQLKPGLSPRLEDIILKCLDKEPGRRYQSAADLRVDLERLTVSTSGAAAAPRPRARPARRRKKARIIRSLAVLPLENLSRDPEEEYFVDGMTEALTTTLAKIGGLRVISRTSAMRYKGTDKPLAEIAGELDVDAVVEGSVLRVGDRVRITAQLIQAATDAHLWAESYDRELSNVLALHSQVAQAIAKEVQVMLTPREQAQLARSRPIAPEVHEAYLKGRFCLNKRTTEGFQKALEYFQQAIDKDPTCAPAYAGLADSYAMLGSYVLLPPKEAYPRAKAAARKALEIDDTLAEAHTSLAGLKGDYDWDWVGAEEGFQRALELNPNYANAHHWYAQFLVMMGRFDDAIAEMNKAKELDPLSPRINTDVGFAYYYARRFDEAIAQYRKVLELDPTFGPAHAELGRVYEEMGKYEEAIAERQKGIEYGGGRPEAELGHAYALAGRREEALKILEEATAGRGKQVVSATGIALIYAGLREKEQALDWLEKAYAEHDYWLAFVKVEPRFALLHDHPRFQDLLRRMNYPPA